MKKASHMKSSRTSSLRLLPEVGLVDLSDRGLAERLAGKMSVQLELFASQMREGLLAASVAIGLDVMAELIDAEVSEVAGPKGRHDKSRTANRHGSEDGKVTLGGRRIPVRRPRVRSVDDREVHLESYDTFASVDLLAEHMVASMLAGLSTRRYQAARTGRRRGRGHGVGDVAELGVAALRGRHRGASRRVPGPATR